MSRILISGSEGDIAKSIALTLREIDFAEKLVGCDMHRPVLSPYYFDDFFRVPSASDESYLAQMADAIRAKQVSIFIPTAEAEIEFLAEVEDLEGVLGCRVVMVDRSVARICLDKLATAECLRAHSLASPETSDLSEPGGPGFPCILKPRKGRGSKGVKIVHGEGEVAELRESGGGGYILQELIGEAVQEYTVGLFVSASGETRVLSLRRELAPGGGATVCGEVADTPEITAYVAAIGKALGLVGAVNVQLRIGPDGPTAFEINPRFSSTVRFRHLLGFNDLQWVLEEVTGRPLSEYERSENGTRFVRQSVEALLPE